MDVADFSFSEGVWFPGGVLFGVCVGGGGAAFKASSNSFKFVNSSSERNNATNLLNRFDAVSGFKYTYSEAAHKIRVYLL